MHNLPTFSTCSSTFTHLDCDCILVFEQALVCPANKLKSTRADVDHAFATWRIAVFFSNCVSLI